MRVINHAITTSLSLGLASVTTASLLVLHKVNAGGESDLRQGMDYEQARKILLDNGWQSTQLPWQIKQESCNFNSLCELPETQWCLTTGTGHCQMKFTDINQRTLILEVSGQGKPALINFYYVTR
jgi:hypothetical protein